MKQFLISAIILFLFSCNKKSENKTQTTLPAKNESQIIIDKTKNKIDKIPKDSVHIDTLSFIDYNDNYDYMLLNAENKKGLSGFINDKNEDRSYLRGDIIEISWIRDTIYIAGDGETPELAEVLISTNKIKDGNVSAFRKTYKKKLKNSLSKENNFADGFLDQLYLIVEYYVAYSRNDLIRSAVANKVQLEYSIEKQTRDGKEYILLGIRKYSESKQNTLQWLLYDYETNKIYEFDVTKDKLTEFK